MSATFPLCSSNLNFNLCFFCSVWLFQLLHHLSFSNNLLVLCKSDASDWILQTCCTWIKFKTQIKLLINCDSYLLITLTFCWHNYFGINYWYNYFVFIRLIHMAKWQPLLCSKNIHWNTWLVSSGVSQSYLKRRRCLFSLGWPPFFWGRCFTTSTSLAPHCLLMGRSKLSLTLIVRSVESGLERWMPLVGSCD